MKVRQQPSITRDQRTRAPRGFTLVEVLTVIVIIGILAAITVPAIGVAIRAAKRGAIRLEIENLGQSLEAYKLQYGEYPPDFVNWPSVERHYLKAFPDIAQEELLLLERLTDIDPDNDIDFEDPIVAHNPVAMDRAEALVWALGGFSKDKRRPFTGEGGPFALVTTDTSTDPDTPIYQINSERGPGFFPMDADDLTIYGTGTGDDEVNPGLSLNASNRYLSRDEAGTLDDPHDLFPKLINESAQGTPYVYFDSRTYGYQTPSGEFNGYIGPGGVVRPFLTDRAVPKTGTDNYAEPQEALKAWEFAEPNRFQIFSAGLDGNFGSLERHDVDNSVNADGSGNEFVYWRYPSGKMIATLFGEAPYSNPQSLVVPRVDKYQESSLNGNTENPVIDNITNFSNSDLESDLP